MKDSAKKKRFKNVVLNFVDLQHMYGSTGRQTAVWFTGLSDHVPSSAGKAGRSERSRLKGDVDQSAGFLMKNIHVTN